MTIIYSHYYNNLLRINRPWGRVICDPRWQAIQLRRIRHENNVYRVTYA